MLNLISGINLINFFFKFSAVVFSLAMLVYTLAIFRQTQVMNKTIQAKRNSIIIFISFLAVIGAIVILFYALFLI
jgi:uncharacterized membrane protein YphA (DoxX/SURF4 family)